MKVEIEKYTAEDNVYMPFFDLKGNIRYESVKKGYTYYIFRTEDKAWIRHSGKLTKEEKQWVIEQDSK